MKKRTFAMAFGVALCATVKASDPGVDPSKNLEDAMENVAALARETVPLAKQEFAVLTAKYKGDRYKNLIARIDAPVEMSEGVGSEKNLSRFRERLEAKDRLFVADEVLGVINQLRGLDGVMLAEAVAGSAQEDRLLTLYQREEAALFHLELAHQNWEGAP